MRRNKGTLVLILIFGAVVSARAQEVKQVFQEGTVEVRSELGKAVEVVVPGGVSNLVRSGDAASLKVEHVSGHLFITPLVRDAAELMVVDGVGRSYRLKFVFGKGLDEKILITAKVNEDYSEKGSLTTIDLIREMAAGRAPAGAVEVMREAVVFEDPRVRIKSVLLYEMPGFNGYVLTAENLLPQSLVVPVEQLNFPGLLAVTAQRDILTPAGTPGAKGLIYMVASR
ncbi:MAG: type-F conjugative transfer system secretin TraK [Candidatus Omnitrophica bacterium]|nr:type-F conjugative transfer system secretin TraK [Candidatus Omnitrophota bacterium]